MLQAVEMEELLDAYGAKNNRKWRNFRQVVATTKLFADVSYELLHVLYYLPIYQLLSISRDFTEATNKALIIDGLLAIQAGQNPRVIEVLLKNYLAEGKRGGAEAG